MTKRYLVIRLVTFGLVIIACGYAVSAAPHGQSTARPALHARIYLCERAITRRIPNAWRDPGHRMPSKEPVNITETRTWIEVFLPEHKLAIWYGFFRKEAFFSADARRYSTPGGASPGDPTAATELPTPTLTNPGPPTSARELTTLTLTHEGMAMLQVALEKYLKSMRLMSDARQDESTVQSSSKPQDPIEKIKAHIANATKIEIIHDLSAVPNAKWDKKKLIWAVSDAHKVVVADEKALLEIKSLISFTPSAAHLGEGGVLVYFYVENKPLYTSLISGIFVVHTEDPNRPGFLDKKYKFEASPELIDKINSMLILGCAPQERQSALTIRCVPAVRTRFTPGDTVVDSLGNESSDGRLESQLIISDRQRVYVFNWLPAPCMFVANHQYTFILESGGQSVESIRDSKGKTIWKQDEKQSRARVPLIRIEELDNVERRN